MTNHQAYTNLVAATERHTRAHQRHSESFGRYIRFTEADLDAAAAEVATARAALDAVAHLCREPGCSNPAWRAGHCRACCEVV